MRLRRRGGRRHGCSTEAATATRLSHYEPRRLVVRFPRAHLSERDASRRRGGYPLHTPQHGGYPLHTPQHRRAHMITANEGAAVGVAAGYHLATGKVPLVYLQNSGIGNTVNPLLSLADPKVRGVMTYSQCHTASVTQPVSYSQCHTAQCHTASAIQPVPYMQLLCVQSVRRICRGMCVESPAAVAGQAGG